MLCCGYLAVCFVHSEAPICPAPSGHISLAQYAFQLLWPSRAARYLPLNCISVRALSLSVTGVGSMDWFGLRLHKLSIRYRILLEHFVNIVSIRIRIHIASVTVAHFFVIKYLGEFITRRVLF